MAKSKEYDKLFKKRENAIRSLKFHIEHAKEITNEQTIEALQRLNNIEVTFEKYKSANDKLEDLDDFDNDEITIKDEDVVEMYTKASTTLKTITKDNHDASILNSTHNRFNNNNHVEVKLPQITIPTFNGEYQEWPAFYDAFMSLVDNNAGLSDVSKMHYLKSSLKGTAHSLIGRMPITEENYKVALNSLVDRFQNKRAIVNKCLDMFINQPAMKTRNAQEIRSIIDTTKEALQCIETLDVCINEWGPFITFIVQSKMDVETKTQFENYLSGSTNIPRYDKLTEFLDTQFRILDHSSVIPSAYENVNSAKIHVQENTNHNKNQQYQNSTNNTNTNTNQQKSYNNEKCPVCPEYHWLLACQKFMDWTPTQRKTFVTNNNICVVCLKAHEKDQCKSKYRCKKCNGAHSVKIHTVYDDANISTASPQITSAAIQEGNNVFATALVKVKDKFGSNHLLRVFIDMGSGGAFISERAAQILCLPRKSDNKQLTGVNDTPLGKSTNSVRIQVESVVDNSFKFTIDTNVLRSIIQPRKFSKNLVSNWNHLKDIELADPEFVNPSHIDLLFGVDIYGLIIKNGIRKGLIHEPVAQNSHLGWLVLGATSNNNTFSVQVNSISIENQLQKLWENEEVLVKPIMTEEHSKCVEHFENTHTRIQFKSKRARILRRIKENGTMPIISSRKTI